MSLLQNLLLLLESVDWFPVFQLQHEQSFFWMASTARAQLSRLPWPEVLAYWLLSFGSHLYSFYQLHLFSKGQYTSVCLFTLEMLICDFLNIDLSSVALWAFFLDWQFTLNWLFLIICFAFQSMKQDYKGNFSWKRAFLRVSKGCVKCLTCFWVLLSPKVWLFIFCSNKFYL